MICNFRLSDRRSAGEGDEDGDGDEDEECSPEEGEDASVFEDTESLSGRELILLLVVSLISAPALS